jgi:hypothetical protein
MFCTQCGREISLGSSFCTNCGAPITGAQKIPAKQRRKWLNGFSISGIIILIFALIYAIQARISWESNTISGAIGGGIQVIIATCLGIPGVVLLIVGLVRGRYSARSSGKTVEDKIQQLEHEIETLKKGKTGQGNDKTESKSV